ncbi:MAG: peptide chain release factor N(5)-glutamine methyltransferase [Gammaproteobacteria bacterium]|nr:MAG: peptide chain release factor N(5)-glutamine methyltransferase [Gammaproteobacteria bacterium]
MQTIGKCLRSSSALLTERLSLTLREAMVESEILLQNAIGKNRTYLSTWPEKILNTAQQDFFQKILQRRLNGEPIAHIIGTKDFWDFTLKVTKATLIPRSDTELIVETALQISEKQQITKILDMGTGSGAIAIALARKLTKAEIHASDNSSKALEVAKQNGTVLADNKIVFYESDWFKEITETGFDIILSNPPYISTYDKDISPEVACHEPKTALFSTDNGLSDIKKIAAEAAGFLNHDGWLLLEHGYRQAEDVAKIMSVSGFTEITTALDIQGHQRVTYGKKK